VANLGNKKLILQVLKTNFYAFGVETGNIDLRQSHKKFFVELIHSRERLHRVKTIFLE
jgi:hypothetical protein